jgi:predicted acylesterase/phospholipase RssA
LTAVDLVAQAEAITEGAPTTVAAVSSLVEKLSAEGLHAPIVPMLAAVSRRALYRGWEPNGRVELAKTLREYQQFGYARRVLARIRDDGPDSEYLRQQHALCTYKDEELPAARRLDRALQILTKASPIDTSIDAETLGIAGAILKRKWELEAKRADLERSLWFYDHGFQQKGHPSCEYAGINAAFVSDQLAALELQGLGGATEAERFRNHADDIRKTIIETAPGDDDEWRDTTLGEAFFGLGDFDKAREHLERARNGTKAVWRLATTATQLGALANLRGFDSPAALAALRAFVGDEEGAVRRVSSGKVGLALSGGGFRASLFHIGVLARLAECDVLRRVEVLSCVSGGSIVGAFYYLKLRRLLQSKPDDEILGSDYVGLVREIATEFLNSVRQDIRGRLGESIVDNFNMLSSEYSRTDRAADLFEELIYAKVLKDEEDDPTQPWRMTDLYVRPHGAEREFSLRYDNWRRDSKVPILVLNATTLNTGHNWQFTASWMGETATDADENGDATPRLRRVYYDDAPKDHRMPPLARAVAASACVPGLFPPVAISGLYPDVDIELVDGGAYDNQGIASLLDENCTVILVSDASGQIRANEHPKRGLLGVANRSNSVLMSRVRGAQYELLTSRLRSQTLRGLMVVHLRKGLWAEPVDWEGCQEPYDPRDDELPRDVANRPSAYGIDRDVQRALAQLRTDLDAFSDDEAYALMATGYRMTAHELEGVVTDVVGPAPTAAGWPFESMLARICGGAETAALADELAPGRARFFRGFIGWRERRSRRPQGRIQRVVDSAARRTIPAGAHAADRVVVSPVRKVVSAPVAVAGAVGSRLYLRWGRRR